MAVRAIRKVDRTTSFCARIASVRSAWSWSLSDGIDLHRAVPGTAVLHASTGPFLQRVDALGGLGLRQIRLRLFSRFSRECLKVRGLGPGHRLLPRHPLVGILQRPWVLLGHEFLLLTPVSA